MNAKEVVTTIFMVVGVLVALYGVFKLFSYFKIKQQFNFDNNYDLVNGILSTTMGLLTILLASILSNAIQIITGIWLLILGVTKLKYNKDKVDMILGVIYIALGIYTILFENAVLIFLGVVLIVTAIYDLFINIKANHVD